jgi:hypothetical protein
MLQVAFLPAKDYNPRMEQKNRISSGNADGMSEFCLEKPVARSDERYMKGPDSLANRLAGLMRAFAPKYGFVSSDIVIRWEEIAGSEVARMAVPQKISFPRGKRQDGILLLKLNNASYAAILQYSFPAIIDRVNTYFGYNAIKEVRIRY